VIVTGSDVPPVWENAFRQLGSSKFGEDSFDSTFASDTEIEIKSWLEGKVSYPSSPTLDGPISRREVSDAIKALRRWKAPGMDGIVSEILKYGGDTMEESVWKLCQIMFNLEQIPRDWGRGIISPIHKDGDERIPDNYRGITLLSIVGKLYSSILSKRVSQWCEEEGKISEEQAGFRRNRSTTDQLFILSEILQARKELHLDTVSCFLDIRKAYDTVFRDGVWKRLLEIGIDGKLWRVIRNLYAVVESCVQLGSSFTQWFEIEIGLRQGDTLSCILYIIFIDGLIDFIKQSPLGVKFGSTKINILGYADDLFLIAESRADMQHLLDLVHLYSRKWRFLFNVEKSKVLIFTAKRPHRNVVPLYLGIGRLEEVTQFRYLGVELKSNMSWKLMKQRVVFKARSRLALISKAIADGLKPDASLKLWCSLIRPILEDNCEIWAIFISGPR